MAIPVVRRAAHFGDPMRITGLRLRYFHDPEKKAREAMTTPAPTSPATVICVTPVRNEAWILERFLTAAELWADHIVIADQRSTDGSREIAQSFEKVRVVDNDAPAYDEGARQRLLLSAAREIPGPRLIVALDADEMLSPTWTASQQWDEARRAVPGTVFAFDWINVLPNGTAYVPSAKVPFAVLDDGIEHAGGRIHSTRVPVPAGAPVRSVDEVAVLHLQYTDWRRMKSKQRWYQCWEVLNEEQKRPIQIYRQYHRMDAFPPAETRTVDPAWFASYARKGVEILAPSTDEPLWWDDEVLEWMLEEGPETFRRLNIWDVDWRALARARGRREAAARLHDPRTQMERAVHRWLARTQGRVDRFSTRWLQRALILAGW